MKKVLDHHDPECNYTIEPQDGMDYNDYLFEEALSKL